MPPPPVVRLKDAAYDLPPLTAKAPVKFFLPPFFSLAARTHNCCALLDGYTGREPGLYSLHPCFVFVPASPPPTVQAIWTTVLPSIPPHPLAPISLKGGKDIFIDLIEEFLFPPLMLYSLLPLFFFCLVSREFHFLAVPPPPFFFFPPVKRYKHSWEFLYSV